MARDTNIWWKIQGERDKFEPRFARSFKQALMRQIEPVIEAIRERGADNIDLAGLIREEVIREEMIRLYQVVGSHFARSTYAMLKKEAHPILRKEITDIWLMFMRNFALSKCGNKITWITETTRSTLLPIIQGAIDYAVQEGRSIPAAASTIIESIYAEYGRIAEYRAVRIARTEIVGASNAGSLEGARQTGLNLMKEWLATQDDRVRDRHAEMNGRQVELDGKFTVGMSRMDAPGDPAGAAEDVINCRCTIVYNEI